MVVPSLWLPPSPHITSICSRVALGRAPDGLELTAWVELSGGPKQREMHVLEHSGWSVLCVCVCVCVCV
jgi:hypothetical protein